MIEQSGLSEADYRREMMFEERGIDEPMSGQSGFVFPDGRMVEISHEKTQTHYGDIEWLCHHCEPDTTASRGDLTARALVISEGNVEWNDKYNEFTMDFNHRLTDEQKEYLWAFIDEAKDKMINASLGAMEFYNMLPAWRRPEHTDGYDGFYHLLDIKGNCEHCEMNYIVREANRAKFEAMKEYIGTDCMIVCHGGVIAGLMLTWFPGDETAEHFYAWQPKPSEGYRIDFDDELKPVSYKKIALE